MIVETLVNIYSKRAPRWFKVIKRHKWMDSVTEQRKETVKTEGLFYHLPNEKDLVQVYGIASPFDLVTTNYYKALGGMPMMIRKPALDVIDYINRTKPDMPNVKMLLYGDLGHGKTHTLAHLIHYLHSKQEHFVLHVRDIRYFTKRPNDHSESLSRPGRIDTPVNAAILLQQFRVQNANLLEKHKDTLVCSKDYSWSLREITKAGEPLLNLAEHGVNRINHASDCYAVLVKELMLASDAGKIKLATVIDNVRNLFLREAGQMIKHDDFKKVLIDEITVARALKKLIKGSYKNGFVIGACDDRESKKLNQRLQEVIGQEGWEHFDPFLPIHVPKYTRTEFESCMDMYEDMGWLCRAESRTQEVRDEIRFISGLNPGQVCYLCKAL